MQQIVCVTMEVFVTNLRLSLITKSLALSFVAKNEVRNSYAQVYNRDGIVVGEVLSDIVDLSLANVRETVYIDQFCIRKRFSGQEPEKYGILDFGVMVSPNKFRPLLLDQIVQGKEDNSPTFLCGSDIVIQSENSSISFALIARIEDPNGDNGLSRVEEVFLFLSGSLFSVGFVLVVCFMFLHFKYNPTIALLCLLFQTSMLFVVRGIYFFLVGTLVLPADDDIVDYILIELPTFFYLGVFVQILVTFYYTFQSGNSGLPQSRVWKTIFCCLLVVWLSFGIVIAVLATSDSSGDLNCSCDNRVCETTDADESVEIIRIVYKSVVLAFAGIVLAILGYFWKKGNSSKIGKWFRKLLATSICLLLNCIAFLIYYIVDSPTVYFVIVLWATELAPLIWLCGSILPIEVLGVWKMFSSSMTNTVSRERG